MKILHVINTLKTGGAEKLLADIVPLLKEKGHDVDVYVFDGSDTTFKRHLEAKGVKIISYKENCNVYNPLIIIDLIRVLGRYDIVHAHNTSPQFFCAISSLFKKMTLITTEHSTSNRRRNHKIFKIIDKWVYSRYKRIIAISKNTKKLLAEYIPSLNKIEVIYNGIELDKYSHLITNKNESPKKFIITMIAGFRYQKDHETPIKALSYLNKDEYEMWYVGDGNEKDKIVRMIKEFGVEDQVKLLGKRDDIPSIINKSDVIIQISHIEGFGLAAVEGMASKKPVIATDIPGLNEVVDGAGILVEHRDEVNLAKEIEKLAKNKEHYRIIAEKCYERASLFDIHKTVSNYLEIYINLCRNK